MLYEEVEGPDGKKIIKRKGKRIRLTKPGEPEKNQKKMKYMKK